MKIISYLLVSIALLNSIHSFSQDVEKAFKLLEQKDLDKSFEILQKALQKNKDVIAARFGIATIFSHDAYVEVNLKMAYTHVKFIQSRYDKLGEREKTRLNDKYNINSTTIEELNNYIVSFAYSEAQKENTPKAIDKFLTNYKDTPQANKIWGDFYKAYTSNGKLNTFIEFQHRFPDFPDKKQMWMDIYSRYTIDGEQSTYIRFAQDFPIFPFKDTLKKDLDIASFGESLRIPVGVKSAGRPAYEQYIKEAAPKELAFVALQRVLEFYIDKKDWVTTLKTINQFQPYFGKDDKRLTGVTEIINRKDQVVDIKSIGNVINTKAHEFAPYITTDGKQLYFCGFRREDNLGSEDIFVSDLKNGQWDKPQLVKGLNTVKGNEAPESITADGTRLLIFMSGDIHYTDKTKDGWDILRPFTTINTKYWEGDVMITSDGQTMIFSSDRPGGIGDFHKKDEEFHGYIGGNIDIYISHKINNSWGVPINIGATINTPYCERCAFLHPDMKTMYFSSDGHPGLGKMDVFKTTRLYDTSWTQWSEPVNLGKEINTSQDDWGYRISTDGNFGYFSAFAGDNYDILYFNLLNEFKPENVATISGKLLDLNGKPVEATIRWDDLTTGKPIGESKSNPDGSYFIVLPLNKLYGFYVDKEQYFPVSGNLDLRITKQAINKTNNIQMVRISEMKEQGLKIQLKNLFFDNDKFDLKPESYPELDRLVEILQKNKELKLEISGHTDNNGTDEHNQTLSENRVKSVREYLVKKGCKAANLTSVGYGEKKPIATNDTEEGRGMNRRVEVRFIK
jgi:outer membrane protein OmpA-like peptidoglycan-associated protein